MNRTLRILAHVELMLEQGETVNKQNTQVNYTAFKKKIGSAMEK